MTEYGGPRGRQIQADDPAWYGGEYGHGSPPGGVYGGASRGPDGSGPRRTGSRDADHGGGRASGQRGSDGRSRDGSGSSRGSGSRGRDGGRAYGSGGTYGSAAGSGTYGSPRGDGHAGWSGTYGSANGSGGHGGSRGDGSSGTYGSPRDDGYEGSRRDGSGGGYGSSRGDGSRTYGSSRADGSGGKGSAGVYGSGSSRPPGGTAFKPGTGKPGPGRPGTGKKAKRRSPIWTKLTIVLGSVVLVAAVLGMVGLNLITGEVNNAVTQEAMINHGAQPVNIKGAINILMVGLDTRDSNPGMGSRSDSIIIAHIPASHDQVDLISIPRDTYVPIPAFPKTHYAGGSTKINAAFQFGSSNGGGDAGGMQLLQATITQNYHIDFQAALIVNFDGFTDIVKKLGGVTMYVDEKTISLHHGYLISNPTVHAAPFKIHPDGTPGAAIPGTKPVIYQKGTQHLSAYAALDYVRCRDFLPNADYDRQRHQQQFIKAVMEEAYQKGISDPTQISDFLKSISKAFIWDGGGRALSDWIFTLKGISPSAIRTLKINNGTYNTVMVGKMSTQQMSAISLQLLNDVTTDTVENFIAEHPDWVTQS